MLLKAFQRPPSWVPSINYVQSCHHQHWKQWEYCLNKKELRKKNVRETRIELNEKDKDWICGRTEEESARKRISHKKDSSLARKPASRKTNHNSKNQILERKRDPEIEKRPIDQPKRTTIPNTERERKDRTR